MPSKTAELLVTLSLKKEGFDKGVKSTKSSMKDMGKAFLGATAAVAGTGAAVYLAGKQIYEVGKRGAIVTQTADSFDFLSEKLGLAPDLLDQLSEAARGTIPDFQLMSSTATLLAGTTDTLGKALGDSTPQLMEIAKAANKLNPSLGTTAHMYDSLALGIKRASPMILDNLGLTIKIGTANEKYAAQIGKTVDQLSAEDKQIALLNATLEAGDNLLAQVGGTTESATDSFAIMETNVANLKDELAQGLAPAISAVVAAFTEAIEDTVEWYDTTGLLEQAMKDNILTTSEYNDLLFRLKKGYIDAAEMTEVLADITGEYDARAQEVIVTTGHEIERFHALAGVFTGHIEKTNNAVVATDGLIGSTDNWITAMIGSKGALEELSDVLDGLYQNALKAATDSVYELERAKIVLMIASGALKGATEEETTANINNALSMLDSIDRMEKLTQAVKDGTVADRDLRLALMDSIVTLDEYNELMGISADEMDGAEQEAYQLRDAHGQATSSTNTLKGSTDLLSGSMATAASKAADLEASITRLKSKEITITTRFRTKGDPYIPLQHGAEFTVPSGYPDDSFLFPMALTSGERVKVTPAQHGLSMTVPSGYPNDSFYFPMALSSGERVEVTPRSEVGRSARQSKVTNYNSLNIYTNAPIEADVPDLLLLRAWASG